MKTDKKKEISIIRLRLTLKKAVHGSNDVV